MLFLYDMKQVAEYLLPKVEKVSHGAVDQVFQLEYNFKVKSNCPSQRLQHHLESSFSLVLSEKESSEVNLIYDLPLHHGTPEKFLQEVYPLGFIQPHDPLFIIISPSSMNIDPKIIIRHLKWIQEWQAADYRTTDEYHLLVGKFVQITSRSERGLFYGLQTLIQLLRLTTNQIPYQTIQDRPKLAMRTVHIDLKEGCPNILYLNEQIKILASAKVNALLVEWEDKFPFTGDLEVIAHKAALTIPEVGQWLEECYNYYLEVIPLIQSMGHLEYALKNPKFQSLSELNGFSGSPATMKKLGNFMICPLNQNAKEFVLALHGQILTYLGQNKNSKYIHLGLDEAYALGSCPKCQNFIGQDPDAGKSKLFIEYVNWIAGHYLKQGKIPIIWCDMLVRHPQLIDTLDKRIIIADWEYEHPLPLRNEPLAKRRAAIDPTGETIDYVRTWSIKTFSEIQAHLPESSPFFLESAWKSRNPKSKYPLNAFPYLKYFKEKGFTVLSCPAVQCCRKTPFSPNYAIQTPNIVYSNINAVRHNISGSICTNWVIRNSLWPSLHYGFLIYAETAWAGEIISEADFNSRFWQFSFLKQIDTTLLDEIKPLASFFTLMGMISEEYHVLLNAFSKKAALNFGVLIDLPTIEKVVFPRMAEFQTLLQKIQPLICRNTLHFECIQLLAAYALVLDKALHLVPEVEQIAINIEEESSEPIPSLERLEKLYSGLIELQADLKEILPVLTQMHAKYLQKAEIDLAESSRLRSIAEEIITLVGNYNNFYTGLKEFVDSTIKSNMKRFS
jgi:hypothetical protein